MLKQNEGVLDRIVRLGLAAVLLPTGLLLGGLQAGVFGIAVTAVGAIALLTGITGVCLLYIPFGFSTLEKERQFISRCKSMMGSCGPRGSGWGMGMCGPRAESEASKPEAAPKGVQI